jgi:hypothetical protein
MIFFLFLFLTSAIPSIHRVKITSIESNSSIQNSKAITAVPTLYLSSSSSWGTFTTSGPDYNQQIVFTISGSSGQYWNLYNRFDSESWSFVRSCDAGQWTLIVYWYSFSGSRLSLGSHIVSIQARDSVGSVSNTISVSYSVTLPIGAIVGIVSGVIALVGIVILIWWFVRRRRNALEASRSVPSLVQDPLLAAGYSGYPDQGGYVGAKGAFPPQVGYPQQAGYPWQPGYPPPPPNWQAGGQNYPPPPPRQDS